ACRGHGRVRAAQAKVNRDVARRRVGNHFRDNEGTDLARPALDEPAVLLLILVEPANPAAEDDATAIRVFARKIEAAVLYRGHRGHQGELREAIQPARDLAIQNRLGLEVLHFAGKLDFEAGSVDLLDRTDAAPAGAKCAPELLDIHSERVHRAQAGDDNA